MKNKTTMQINITKVLNGSSILKKLLIEIPISKKRKFKTSTREIDTLGFSINRCGVVVIPSQSKWIFSLL